jgi:hypothetical protein
LGLFKIGFEETGENSVRGTSRILINKFRSGAQRGEDEMGRACSSMVKREGFREFWWENMKEKPFGRPRRRWRKI